MKKRASPPFLTVPKALERPRFEILTKSELFLFGGILAACCACYFGIGLAECLSPRFGAYMMGRRINALAVETVQRQYAEELEIYKMSKKLMFEYDVQTEEYRLTRKAIEKETWKQLSVTSSYGVETKPSGPSRPTST